MARAENEDGFSCCRVVKALGPIAPLINDTTTNRKRGPSRSQSVQQSLPSARKRGKNQIKEKREFDYLHFPAN